MTKSANQIEHGTVSFGVAPDATLVVRFSGSWHLDRNLPPSTELIPVLDARPTAKRISFDTTALADWDSGLLSFLTETDELCRNRGIVADRAGLPTGLRRLLELAEAVPEKKGTQAAAKRESFFARVGNSTLAAEASAREFLSFVGQLTIAFGNLLRGRARYRSADLIEVIQQCGASAVGIVTLISFLVGVILAFMGAVQLSQFGAAIYVADLVGIGMVREMGAMMTAIIMSGRTGAAFAAKLGTMKVTEEFLGEAPNLAVLDGEIFTVTPTTQPAASVPGIVTCTLPPTRLGFASPSLFLITRSRQEGDGVAVFARTEDVTNAQAYMKAATMVIPLIHRWLGTEPRGTLNIVDLPEKGDAPFEDGSVLFTNVQSAEPYKLGDTLIHSLTHLYFHSSYPWLQEGVASFMGSLWLEQNLGKDAAIERLDNSRGALSLAEPGDTADRVRLVQASAEEAAGALGLSQR